MIKNSSEVGKSPKTGSEGVIQRIFSVQKFQFRTKNHHGKVEASGELLEGASGSESTPGSIPSSKGSCFLVLAKVGQFFVPIWVIFGDVPGSEFGLQPDKPKITKFPSERPNSPEKLLETAFGPELIADWQASPMK